MKRSITFILLNFLCVLLYAQEIPFEWIKENYQKREVMIPMRDGVKLYAAIYEPSSTHSLSKEKHPILINRTPYSCSPYGTNMDYRLFGTTYAPYIKAGYIMVFTDVRGKNFSEGEFMHIRPFIPNKKKKQIDEASDAYDTVEWLVKNTQNNNNVGFYGISYNGFYSTMAALSGHPAVKAVSPQAPVTDWYRGDDVHHNGVLFPLDMVGFLYWFQFLNVKEIYTGERGVESFKVPRDIVQNDCYTDFLKFGAVKNISTLYGDSIGVWKDIVNHPDLDDTWEERNVSYHLKNVKPAVMVVGGLFDAEDCYGAWRTYRAIKEQSPQTDLYLVEGPWAHGQWAFGAKTFFGELYFGEEQTTEYYINNIEYPFFAYYLEGKGQKPAAGATIFQTGENRWYSYPEGWNEPELTPYYIYSNGGLSSDCPSTNGNLTYTSDPQHPVPYYGKVHESRPVEYMFADQRFASQRTDVLTFETPVLSDTLRLDGPVDADLNVSISTTDADFVVKVIDVFPDGFRYDKTLYPEAKSNPYFNAPNLGGYAMLVRGDIMRGKYRESFRDPKPFVPGEKTTVKFRLPDVAHSFLPGHKLMIQIQSSWFPLADRNPQKFCNIYTCDDSDFQKSDITIYEGSRILLPVR